MKRILKHIVLRLFPRLNEPDSEIMYTAHDASIAIRNLKGWGAKIKSHEFKNGYGKITFKGQAKRVPKKAFEYCKTLTTINLPKCIKSIERRAFAHCKSLTNITIPDSVTSIGDEAFYYCTSLTSVTIPDSVTKIGYKAFWNYDGLTRVNVHISDLAKYCTWNRMCEIPGAKHLYLNGTEITNLVIPNSVTEIGERAFDNCDGLTSITIPNSVTEIGGGAFTWCRGLKSIAIPNSVTEIGGGAFAWCDGLTSITIPNSVTSIGDTAFYDCSRLTSVTIPDSVTSIGSCAFYDCRSLTSVIIPNSVTKIGAGAFSGCSSLENITIPNGITIIYGNTFSGCTSLKNIAIPNSVTKILSNAFNDCSLLTSVHISDWSAWFKIDFSGDTSNPFYYARNIYLNDILVTELVIPTDISEIKSHAFNNCHSLKIITIPDSVTSIVNYAFEGYTGELVVNCNIPKPSSEYSSPFIRSRITKVTIGANVTSIGDHTFNGCIIEKDRFINMSSLDEVANNYWGAIVCDTIQDDGLCIKDNTAIKCIPSATDIVIPNNVTKICKRAFDGCKLLTNATIGNSVTSIEHEAFNDCRCLTSITIPNSVSTIEARAFCCCSYLTNITIPNSVTKIGSYAFLKCCSLISVTIGKSISLIYNAAFADCELLTSVYCQPTTPPAGSKDMFLNNAANRKIYVPYNSVEAYKSAEYWKEYADDIVGYDF